MIRKIRRFDCRFSGLRKPAVKAPAWPMPLVWFRGRLIDSNSRRGRRTLRPRLAAQAAAAIAGASVRGLVLWARCRSYSPSEGSSTLALRE